MVESRSRQGRAVSTTSPNGLLAPTGDPFTDNRPRSTSLAPSFHSHVTTVEEKEDSVEFGNISRRQTFKIQRKPTLWDWFKGAFNREAFMRRLENSVKIVQPEAPPEMLAGSEFIVTVLVSPRDDGTNYKSTRCLLDTGCLSGNLVTRDLVERLGYVESDFEPPTPYESQEGQTLTGERFPIEAAVFLSWHHKSSPVIYRDMRFLIVSSSRFEMIIGSDTISKHGLLTPPVFHTGVIDEDEEDPMVIDPKIKHRSMHAKIVKDKQWIEVQKRKPESERDAKGIKLRERRLPRRQFMREVLQHRLNAAEFHSSGKFADEKRELDLAEKEVDAWNKKHPRKKTTDATPAITESSRSAPTRPPTKRESGHSK